MERPQGLCGWKGCSPRSLLTSGPSAPQLPQKGSPLLSDTSLRRVGGLEPAPVSEPGGTWGFLEPKENSYSQLHRFFVLAAWHVGS